MEVLKAEQVEKRLLAYVAGDRVHPALILTGASSTTKNQTVRRMAKALLCPKRQSLPPFCGACSTCRRIESGSHPDVIWVGNDNEDTIKIDQVRELCHQMELSPVEGSCKIAVIEDCQRLNTSSGNAFLKSLEEPGPGRYFWLLTPQIGSLLPTIVSRCLTFAFPESQPATESADAWNALLEKVANSGDFNALASALKEKDKCLELVHYLQVQWRLAALHPYLGSNPAGVFQSASFWDALILFDEAVQLEGRLRSNANPGLLLESHLRETLLSRSR